MPRPPPYSPLVTRHVRARQTSRPSSSSSRSSCSSSRASARRRRRCGRWDAAGRDRTGDGTVDRRRRRRRARPRHRPPTPTADARPGRRVLDRRGRRRAAAPARCSRARAPPTAATTSVRCSDRWTPGSRAPTSRCATSRCRSRRRAPRRAGTRSSAPRRRSRPSPAGAGLGRLLDGVEPLRRPRLRGRHGDARRARRAPGSGTSGRPGAPVEQAQPQLYTLDRARPDDHGGAHRRDLRHQRDAGRRGQAVVGGPHRRPRDGGAGDRGPGRRRRPRGRERALLRRVPDGADARSRSPSTSSWPTPGVIDLVIGHHAHVPQPVAHLSGGPRGEGMWVAYGLGNYVSNQDGACCAAEHRLGPPADGARPRRPARSRRRGVPPGRRA